MKKAERITKFVNEIWQWYARHKRELPWRDLDIDYDAERAYRILISEVMLQQTQVSRVKIVFKEFLRRYPKISDLASATNKDVILAWRGMGYNNRALRLRDAAIRLSEYENNFPVDMEVLQSIPGVGHYTAAAIRNFAFNLPTPCLDTNIRRIIHRAFIGPEYEDGTWKESDATLLKIASELLERALSEGDARNWHAALMDYGSLVCTKRNPKWDVCPLTKAGVMRAAYKSPLPSPITKVKKKEPGRMVGSVHIPNRIFRGKVIEELRDETGGLSEEEIGRRICIDWNADEHTEWLRGIIASLKKDHLLKQKRRKFVLAD